jgi:transcription elongation GreA/GreB family factor
VTIENRNKIKSKINKMRGRRRESESDSLMDGEENVQRSKNKDEKAVINEKSQKCG